MKVFKVLNLYACLGGNRYKWDEVAKEANIKLEVTAVELDQSLAELYQERFPSDKVILDDAHKYLLDHYQEFDFIWSSPPCPSHSRARYWGIGANGKKPIYPDFTLYQEIVFLKTHCKAKYLVENVIPYYEPLIPAQKRNRHLYWCNFTLPKVLSDRNAVIGSGKNEVKNLCKFHDFDFNKYKGNQRLNKIARNLVDYQAGRTILETVLNIESKSKSNQVQLNFN